MTETTLTELLLTELAYADPERWRVVKYTSEEKNTGADWDWWIQRGDLRWIRLRVQAKRLYPNDAYQQLHHRVGGAKGPLQSDALIGSSQWESRTHNLSTFPVYAFYNSLPGRRTEPWICCGLNRYQPLLGITIAPATSVASLAAIRRIRYVDILPVSKPVSCLVHCPRRRTLNDSAGSHAQLLLDGIQWLHGGGVRFGGGLALPQRVLASFESRHELEREPGDPKIALVTSHQRLDEVRYIDRDDAQSDEFTTDDYPDA
ncbi:DUF6615 family protein [Streptomyces cellulosae]